MLSKSQRKRCRKHIRLSFWGKMLLHYYYEEKPMDVMRNTYTWHLGAVIRILLVAIGVTVLASSTLVARAATASASFTRYDISASGGFAIGITVDKHSNSWFGLGNGSIGTINHLT